MRGDGLEEPRCPPLHRTELLAMLLETIIYLYSTPPLARRHPLRSRKRVQLTWRDANMSAKVQMEKERFAGGSTSVVIIPDFIRVLKERSTIYSFTLERGSHKNARTGSPEAPKLRGSNPPPPPPQVYTKLSHHSFITSKRTVILSVFLSSIVMWVFPAAPRDTRDTPPDTEMGFFMLYPQTVPTYSVQVAKNDAARYNSPAECCPDEETQSFDASCCGVPPALARTLQGCWHGNVHLLCSSPLNFAGHGTKRLLFSFSAHRAC